MSSVDYLKRAEWCAERARMVARTDDRARWLQLAGEWRTISRIQFHRLPSTPPRGDAYGLWRGEGIRQSDDESAGAKKEGAQSNRPLRY